MLSSSFIAYQSSSLFRTDPLLLAGIWMVGMNSSDNLEPKVDVSASSFSATQL